MDLPRVIGVSLLISVVFLQATHVKQIKQERSMLSEELKYRAHTIFPAMGKDERLV